MVDIPSISAIMVAILIWLVAAMLILNLMLKSGWILLISIAIVIIAVVFYFIPRLRK